MSDDGNIGALGYDWAIYIASPPGYAHARAFDEHAHCMHYAFAELGQHAPIVWQWRAVSPGRRPLVFAPQMLAHCPEADLPSDAILYNFEQVSPESGWIDDSYLELLRRYEVWDYSRKNVLALAALGVTNVRLCPVGFMKQMAYLRYAFPTEEIDRDVDVLFYGSLNPRRQRIIDGLRDRGARVRTLFGTYGHDRDAWIMRSKIVLNVHFYDAKIPEMIRLSHLLANRRFVVSERGDDPELEAPLEHGIAFAAYDEIVDRCMEYLQRPLERELIAARGFEAFSKCNQAEILRPLLTAEGD